MTSTVNSQEKSAVCASDAVSFKCWVEEISTYNPITAQRLEQFTQMFFNRSGDPPVIAQQQAYALLDRTARREANVMAYNDCFFMGYALLLSALLVVFCKKVKPTGGSAGH